MIDLRRREKMNLNILDGEICVVILKKFRDESE